MSGPARTRTLAALIRKVRLVVFDFDGVFTDNTVMVSEDGSESVSCWRGDGLGLRALKDLGVEVFVLSMETNRVVSVRCQKLAVPVVQACEDKHRALANLGGTGRSIDVNKFVHDYLGKPDMDMASIAKGFGVDGERAKTPTDVKAALARARRHNAEGRPYLIDAEVARHGPGWAEDPWVPTICRT